ncbi:uncharacterized protein [Amphiura filiformis]|uniref:uncharacterized protein isoform X1 n=1 Tax=Amphiura filiformis TaxID=82378 RepID=UPI003B217CC9
MDYASYIRPFVCKYCKKVYSDFICYRSHMQRHRMKIQAHWYGKYYRSYTQRHMKINSYRYGCMKHINGTGKHSIPTWDANQQTMDGLINGKLGHCFVQAGSVRHERIHTKEKPIKCEYCHKSFTQASSNTRQERIHAEEKPYQCKCCSKSFTYTAGDNTKHERIHTKEKPYQCKYCSSRSSQAGNKTTHERIYTKEKPYQCKYCNKSFSQANNKTTHERIHTKEKPYQCKYCNQSFSQAGTKNRHERSHTKEKPYQGQLWFVPVIITVYKMSKKIDRSDKSSCRLWTGPRKPPTRAGKVYGFTSMKLPGDCRWTKRYAHRLAYMAKHRMLHLGDKMHVAHRCRNTLCVNVEHLSLESAAVNNARTLCAKQNRCTGHGEKKDCILKSGKK